MKVELFSTTACKLPVHSYSFGRSGPKVLILGGVHGDEQEGVAAAWGLIDHFREIFSLNLNLTIVPQFNADGILMHTRQNSRGVDLNRNLPTQDWSKQFKNARYNPGPSPKSEPENVALVNWIDLHKPSMIFSLHSWKPMLNINGKCRPEAEVIHKITGYSIEEDIGYPTPGSLGTYSGLERDIPTLTYEIERGLELGKVVSLHVPAIQEALKVTAGRFQV